jgi:hypothetical protein
MDNYVDKWGRYHDKPVTESNPVPSNNGWIYTAYAEKAGFLIDYTLLTNCFAQCKQFDRKGRVYLIRSPQKPTPPISRDEILGMAALGFLAPKHLNGWSFSPYPIPKFDLIKTIKQAIETIGKHRNYLWQNNMDQLYRFAFSVPLADRHFILQKWGRFNTFYWLIAKIDGLIKGKNGIRWLKTGKGVEEMKLEFSESHPLKMISE